MPQKNTLFNYFTSPSAKKNANEEKSSTRASNSSHVRSTSSNKSLKRPDVEKPTPNPKRHCLSNKDEKTESSPDIKTHTPNAKRKCLSKEGEKKDISPDTSANSSLEESKKTPDKPKDIDEQKRYNKIDLSSFASTPSRTSISGKVTTPSTSKAEQKQETCESVCSTPNKNAIKADDSIETWAHLKLDFLQPGKIRDAEKRLKSDPEYDPSTLFVPESFKKTLTPALLQWWEMKAQHYDCILFFKVGKFYELYHMDAMIGVKELNLVYMKGENAHSGFPEIAYGKISACLVEKGYKVARVEQTETPEMMEERISKSQRRATKFDKVVNRELCQITTKGTRVNGSVDVEQTEASACYLLALTERVVENYPVFGVCFIDTTIGTFNFGQFSDDHHCSRLRTLLAHHPPVQILYERHALTMRTKVILNNLVGVPLKEALRSQKEFWSADKTLLYLAEGRYLNIDDSDELKVPEEFKPFLNESDSLNLSANPEGELAIQALGACIYYLKCCLLDQQILALKKFAAYIPKDGEICSVEEKKVYFPPYMILDGTCLTNLAVIEVDEDFKGSLLQRMDYCSTNFGKRYLRSLICNPFCETKRIRENQEAIGVLLRNSELSKEARSILSRIPDLERLLVRIHTLGNEIKSKTHPDSRAIFYEGQLYSKRNILQFLSALNGFKVAEKLVSLFQENMDVVDSVLLKKYTFSSEQDPEGEFPSLAENLEFFDNAFDHEAAEREGCIIPEHGVDKEYDNAIETLKDLEDEITEYLNEQKQFFKDKVTYFGSGRRAYQLEVSEKAAKRADHSYELSSQRKGFRRYMTAQTKEFLSRALAAEEQKSSLVRDLSRRIFENFSKHSEKWTKAVKCLAELDVLLSLTEYVRTEDGITCIPEIVAPTSNTKPYIRVKNGRHPCVPSPDEFICNDTVMGYDGVANMVVLTGPNMGGKSTLMRQLGLIVIMAQMGCYVPASECSMTLVDRIFTRIGAKDDILSGESTFFVELKEMSAILRHTTKHSLLLVDELGRGTSTYDGTAIATAVVNKLVERECRTFFSTHYHKLVYSFINRQDVYFGHMECLVTNTDADDPNAEIVTFLYKFGIGVCPKSYGFNVAKLGGIPADIISCGFKKCKQLEDLSKKRKLFREFFKSGNTPLVISDLIAKVCSVHV